MRRIDRRRRARVTPALGHRRGEWWCERRNHCRWWTQLNRAWRDWREPCGRSCGLLLHGGRDVDATILARRLFHHNFATLNRPFARIL